MKGRLNQIANKIANDVKSKASKRTNLRHHGVERKTGVPKTSSSPSMSTALRKLHKYQHEISDRFKKFQRVSLRNKTRAVGTILHQDPNTGECIILMDKNAELLKHILPNQITIKNDENSRYTVLATVEPPITTLLD